MNNVQSTEVPTPGEVPPWFSLVVVPENTTVTRELKSIERLCERLWVHVSPQTKPSYYAVRNKLVQGGAAPIQGFDLLQLRLAGVCVEVVATYEGANPLDQPEALQDIPASHLFCLSAEGVQCSQVPCVEGHAPGAWLCFALPKLSE